MKGKVTVFYIDPKPLEFQNGSKIYQHRFYDQDGFSGKFYSKNQYKIGESLVVELVDDGDKYKFQVAK